MHLLYHMECLLFGGYANFHSVRSMFSSGAAISHHVSLLSGISWFRNSLTYSSELCQNLEGCFNRDFYFFIRSEAPKTKANR
ncbi:MAG: hypothetical protein ACD_75C01102G0004 [uncultured bacterium]|nr:MAG: hypothetical protein ACD_75C01102G0004 [uncultured bacterium]